MSSYLIGRRQRVKVQGVCSSYEIVKGGVPQGSLLGPLLFNIYTNDLNYRVSNIALRLYADDTTAYASDTSPTVLEFIINNDLCLLSSWFDDNYLAINNTKTQALPIGPCGYKYDLNLNDLKIENNEPLKS